MKKGAAVRNRKWPTWRGTWVRPEVNESTGLPTGKIICRTAALDLEDWEAVVIWREADLVAMA